MLYEGGLRVPFIAWWPGEIPRGTLCRAPIISVDLFPTLADLAAAPMPAQDVDGVSIASLLRGSNRLNRTDLFWHFPGYLGTGHGQWRTTPVGAIRSGDYKLLQFFENDRVELYNLATDIGERNNLARVKPALANQLKAKLMVWRESIEAPMPRRRASL
jgi:arylsulfatase A-like enzyme